MSNTHTPNTGAMTIADVAALEPGDTFYRKYHDRVLRCVVQSDERVASYTLTDDKYPVTTNPIHHFAEMLRYEGTLFGTVLYRDEASVQLAVKSDRDRRVATIHAQSKQESLDILFREWYGEDGHHPDVVTAMQDRLETLFGVRPER